VEPRGCIDLEGLVVEGGGGVAHSTGGLRIRELGCLADGRFRFEIRLPIQHANDDDSSDGSSSSQQHTLNQKSRQQHRIISLEARTETVGREWIRSLTTERLSYSKTQIHSLQQEKAEFQRQIEDFRHVEGDRDGAIQDAKEWRERYGSLDDALGVLMRWVKKEGIIDNREDVGILGSNGACLDEGDGDGNLREDVEANTSAKEEIDSTASSSSHDKKLSRKIDRSLLDIDKRQKFLSISDEDRALDLINLPGTNFPSLSNACRGLREVLRQTSTEANTTVTDLRDTKLSMRRLDDKLVKAETIINKLWEENCELRDNLKQAKKEKKVLVKEVRSSISNKKEMKEEMDELKREVQRLSKIVVADHMNSRCKDVITEGHDTNRRDLKDGRWGGGKKAPNVVVKKRGLATPEKKLLFELEEHVESTLRLHEQFLEDNGQHINHIGAIKSKKCSTTTMKVVDEIATFDDGNKMEKVSNLVPSVSEAALETASISALETASASTSQAASDSASQAALTSGVTSNLEAGQQKKYLPHKVFEAREGSSSSGGSDECGTVEDPINRTFSPLRPKQLLSLVVDQPVFGHDSCDTDSVITSDSILPLRDRSSSVGVPQEIIGNSNKLVDAVPLPDTIKDKENRAEEYHGKHPLARLNEESVIHDTSGQCVSSSQSLASTKSLITDNGRATSQLVCPLADVMQLDRNQGEQSDLDKQKTGELYHLTFYSSKIGLQFQKVPGNGSSIGMLTDAIADDVIDNGSECATKASRMALELQKISLIRNKGHPQSANTNDSLCPMIVPADIVLVCGFFGFDDNKYTMKPSLGARLVAFDGISVERGPWTFDTVKKGIKARGRPLTLTFRDDFLTTKQRSILTKAAAEVKATIPRSHPTPTFQYPNRPWTNDSSSHQPLHTESTKRKISRNESEVAKATSLAYSEQSHLPIPLMDPYNDHVPDDSDVGTSTSTSYSSRSENWQSFSDSGASSVFSTKFGPFMSGLMLGLSNNEEKRRRKSQKFTPEYFCRTAEPLDCIPHHRDFKASLL